MEYAVRAETKEGDVVTLLSMQRRGTTVRHGDHRAQCQWHLFTAAVVTFSGGAADDRASGAIGIEDHRFFDVSFPLGWSETPRVTMPP